MPAQQCLLTWKDHSGAVVSVFENLLKKNTLVDCTLAAEGQYLKAHKVVLSACSPYFELLFSQESEKNPIVILKDVKFQELEAAVNFIYTGQAEVSEDRLQALLEVADSLQIKGLGSNGNWQGSKEKVSSVKSPNKKCKFLTALTEKRLSRNEDTNPQSDSFGQSLNVPASCNKQIRNDGSSSVHQSFERGSSPALTVSAFSVESSCSVENETRRDSDHLENLEQSIPLPSFTSGEDVSFEENSIIKSEPVTDTFIEDRSDEAERDCGDAVTMMDDQHDWSESVTETMDAVLTNEQDIDYPSERMKTEDSPSENVECMQPNSHSSEGYPTVHVKTEDSTSENVEVLQPNIMTSSEDHPSNHIKTGDNTSENVENMQPSVQSSSKGAGWIELQQEQNFLSIFVNEEPGTSTSWNQETIPYRTSTSGDRAGPSNKMSGSSPGVDNLVIEDNVHRMPASAQFNLAVDGSSRSNVSVNSAYASLQFRQPPNEFSLPRCEDVTGLRLDHERMRSQICDALPNVSDSFRPPSDDPSKAKSSKPSFKCSECNYVTRNRFHLMRHFRTHTGRKPFKCPHCNRAFARKDHLIQHVRIHSREKSCRIKQSKLKCPYCDHTFVYYSNLTEHLRMHAREKPFKCTQCDFASAFKSNLVEHLKIHPGEMTFKCLRCNYAGLSKSNFQKHMKTHTGEKPYKCPYCEYSCRQSNHLTKHVRRHTGEKPFKCLSCDYAAVCKSNLQTHMTTHSVEKPYKCPHCNYACRRKGHLTEHLRTHSEEKPFQCPHCDNAYRHKQTLRLHLRTHEGTGF